jgi:hypothetical protein
MIDFQKYEELAARLNSAVSALWTKVTFIQVAEVINNEVDLRELDKKCTLISDHASDAKRSLSNLFDSMDEDEYFEKYEDDHTRIENLFYAIDDKASAIESIVYQLIIISDKSEEDNFTDKFGDAQNIDITESSKFIRFRRFTR